VCVEKPSRLFGCFFKGRLLGCYENVFSFLVNPYFKWKTELAHKIGRVTLHVIQLQLMVKLISSKN